MKFFTAVITIAMSAAAVAAAAVAAATVPEEFAAQGCIPNGGRCKANGSLGNCCSKFCLQLAGVSGIDIFCDLEDIF